MDQTNSMCEKSETLKISKKFKSLASPHTYAYHFSPLDPTLRANANSL